MWPDECPPSFAGTNFVDDILIAFVLAGRCVSAALADDPAAASEALGVEVLEMEQPQLETVAEHYSPPASPALGSHADCAAAAAA